MGNINGTSNIGQTGIMSVRLNGMRIEDLPLREAALAKHQMPLVIDADRQSKIENILKGYPRAKVEYLKSRIRECKDNIQRTNNFRAEQVAKISEYSGHIMMCQFRDQEIAAIPEDDPERKSKIRELEKKFPPYNVKALQQQIEQFQDAVDRCDDVVTRENASIEELTGTLQLCIQRDAKLHHLGVKIK